MSLSRRIRRTIAAARDTAPTRPRGGKRVGWRHANADAKVHARANDRAYARREERRAVCVDAPGCDLVHTPTTTPTYPTTVV